MKKALFFIIIVLLPVLLIGALYLFQDKLPSQTQVQHTVKNLKPVKEMKDVYQDSIEQRATRVDPDKLRGDTPESSGSRNGKWLGPANDDEKNSPWQSSQNSEWKGPVKVNPR